MALGYLFDFAANVCSATVGRPALLRIVVRL